MSCAEGDTGHVYEGLLPIEIVDVALDRMPPSPTKIMMNVGNPELAFEFQRLPNEGVGLARLEFIINRNVGIHPKALLELDEQPPELKREIEARIAGYASPTEFYVQKIVEGVATIAAAFFPKKVIVRLSDFKSNEYTNLLGGDRYEPHEENPMLGFRGASRYIAPEFYDCFALECEAMKRVRDVMGFTNVEIMIPFVRTLTEAEQVIALLAKNGLARGDNGLRVIMMCELPSNAILAERFLELFRRLLDRLQRHDAADARRRPRLRRTDRDDVRRARRRGEGDALARDQGVPEARQVRRHLRAGAVRPSGSRAMAGRAGDREHVAQSRYGRRDVARAGGRRRGTIAFAGLRPGRPNGSIVAADSLVQRRVCNARHAPAAFRPRRARAFAHRRSGASASRRSPRCARAPACRCDAWQQALPASCVLAWAWVTFQVVALRRGPLGRDRAASRARSRARRAQGDGRLVAGHVRSSTYVGAWLTTIVWRPDGARLSRAVLIVPDMLPADDFRRLRVMLRYARSAVVQGAPASQS